MKPIYIILILGLISHYGLSQEDSFQVVSKINDSLSIIKDKSQYGLIKNNNEVLLKPTYKRIMPIPRSEYLLVVDPKRAGSNLLYDMELLRLHPYSIPDRLLYKIYKDESKYICVFKVDTLHEAVKYGYMDHNGELKIPFEYDWASTDFVEGKAVAKKGDKYGVIDLENKTIVPFKYAFIHKFENGFAIVRSSHEKYGVVNGDGDLIVPEEYKYISPFHLNKAIVSTEKGYGVIDDKNNVIIEPHYTYISESRRETNSSLFKVQSGDKWGVLDRTGQVIIPIQHEEEMGFYLGLIRLTKQGMDGVYDRAGQIVIPFEFDKIRILPVRYIAVYKDGKVGIYGNNGTELIPIEYDEWKRNSWDQFEMTRNGEAILFDL